MEWGLNNTHTGTYMIWKALNKKFTPVLTLLLPRAPVKYVEACAKMGAHVRRTMALAAPAATTMSTMNYTVFNVYF